ncbi:receptor-like protein 12 isoform X4 [Cinnamomum micranthum f. kanehirae]|uniref:Receptor-like protein 12 isoform X4 n=1 Tax=Cinnamomum micranthum f. kanehirae TaxID=337451 RepID=A0A443PRA9_9MAGN|nr:receptor-like protein 12 isoform X4 [Cinnamomum micranthum f. kanehirae]
MKLSYLNLFDAYFFGTVPWQIRNISGLRYLDLHDQYDECLEIENLQWLSHLSSLQYLDMGYVNLSRVAYWLQPINMIPSLFVLCLSSCDLRNSSTLLHLNLTSLTLANSRSLVTLDLKHNRLEGPILNFLCGYCNLLKLDLSSNNLMGDLNGFLKSLTKCGANNLEKHVRLASIREFYHSHNIFSGILPESLGQLSNLVGLKMSYNSLEGAISEAHFTNLTRLEVLDMSANSFVFNVSRHWIPPFQLKRIALRSCQLGP